MTCLKCSVEDCVHNQEHRCCLSDIEVTGPTAETRNETNCASFVQRGNGAQNAVSHEEPATESEICCTAAKCIHHVAGDRCDADCVCVGSYSHRSTCCEETQCETFANTRLQNIHGK